MARIVSTGPDTGTYLTGNAVNDHGIAHLAGTGTQENLTLVTESAASRIVFLTPTTGAEQSGGFVLDILNGGLTIDGI